MRRRDHRRTARRGRLPPRRRARRRPGPHPGAARSWYADARLTNPDGVRFGLVTPSSAGKDPPYDRCRGRETPFDDPQWRSVAMWCPPPVPRSTRGAASVVRGTRRCSRVESPPSRRGRRGRRQAPRPGQPAWREIAAGRCPGGWADTRPRARTTGRLDDGGIPGEHHASRGHATQFRAALRPVSPVMNGEHGQCSVELPIGEGQVLCLGIQARRGSDRALRPHHRRGLHRASPPRAPPRQRPGPPARSFAFLRRH